MTAEVIVCLLVALGIAAFNSRMLDEIEGRVSALEDKLLSVEETNGDVDEC